MVLGLGEIFLVYSGDIGIGADDTRDREPCHERHGTVTREAVFRLMAYSLWLKHSAYRHCWETQASSMRNVVPTPTSDDLT